MNNRITWLIYLFALILLPCADAESATISGTLQYENLVFPETGQGALDQTQLLPIRNVPVDLMELGQTTPLGSTTSDDLGHYGITVDDGLGSREVYIRIYARQDNTRLHVRVINQSSQVYAMTSVVDELDLSQPHAIDINATVSGGVAGAFNIFDQMLRGSDYTRGLSGAAPPLVTVVWYPGASGTYFRSSDRSIHLTSIAKSDTDEFDDDVILHEFGHSIADAYSYDGSSGGSHTLTGRYDPRLAWSEGFATFYAGLIRSESSYIDSGNLTNINGAILISYEMETPSFANTSTGCNNEVAVQAALWDLFDEPAADDEFLHQPDSDFWSIFTQYFNDNLEGQIEDFYDGWLVRNISNVYGMEEIMARFKMEFVTLAGDYLTRTPGNINLTIPPNNAQGINAVLNVSDNVIIDDIRCFVSINHVQPIQMTVILQSPAGTRITLHQGGTGNLQDKYNLVWYGPATWPSPTESLDTFKGETSAGSWVLNVINANSSVTGSLRRWEIIITGQRVNPVPGDVNDDGSLNAFDLFTFSRQWQNSQADNSFLFRKSDVNADLTVDEKDLMGLIGNLRE